MTFLHLPFSIYFSLVLVGLVNAGLTSASCPFPGRPWCTAYLLHCLETGSWNLHSVPPEQAVLGAPRLPLGTHQVSRTSWRPSAVAQAVQIPKQTPGGSCRGLLDSPEHTDFSQLAALKPLLPLAGPGDVVLPPRLIWIRKQRDLRAAARGLRTGT